MNITPFAVKDVRQHALLRKRPRSVVAVDSLDAPSRSSSPHPRPMSPVDADATCSEANNHKWSIVQQRFAAAQWRRGCFYLPLQASSTLSAPSCPHSPAASKISTERDATALDATQSRAATAARHIPPHPWKILENTKGDNRARPTTLPLVKGALVQSAVLLPTFLAPPTMVRLEKWNAYWEIYSTCCADELEHLARQLEEPSAAAGYRRVLLTLSAPSTLPPSLTPPTVTSSSVVAAPGAQDPPYSIQQTLRGEPKAAELPTTSCLSPLSSATISTSGSPPQPLEPQSREVSVASSSCSYSSSYSSYLSSYTSQSRCTSDVDSAASAAHGIDDATALSFLSYALDDLVYHFAHRFGAVEHLETRDSSASGGILSTTATTTPRVIVSVQFTTAEAAGLFLRWVDGLSVAQIITAYWRATRPSSTLTEAHLPPSGNDGAEGPQSNHNDGSGVWWNALEGAARQHQLCLVAKLAPHDPRRPTSKLLLGPNAMVSTPLVQSLFAGLFDAKGMEYRPDLRAFSIEFASKGECRLALHALQCSLWRVFGVSLIFT